MIALFVLGLAAVAVGPVLALLTDDATSTANGGEGASAGMFVALNDNTQNAARRAA